ncbi:MAG: hypothetical protein ACFCU4_06955, partial [Puniceicoccaceae bacterium]
NFFSIAASPTLHISEISEMKMRKNLLLALGIAEILVGFWFDLYYPRALSDADEFEARLLSQYVEQINENPNITDETARQFYLDQFERDASVLSDTVRGVVYTKDKMFLALSIAGLITIAVAVTIKPKKGEIQSR